MSVKWVYQIVTAAPPRPFYGDPVKECSCTAIAISRYQKKISGPLLERIDIHVEVPRVDSENLADKRSIEDSKTVRARVQATRERQVESVLQISLCLGICPDASDDGVSHFSELGKNT